MRSVGLLVAHVLLLEALHTSFGVHDLLRARKEGVAVGTNVHLDVPHRRAGLELEPARATDRRLPVLRMNPGFHDTRTPPSAIHGVQEILVRLGTPHFVYQKFHGLHGPQRAQDLAEDPHLVQSLAVHQQLFLAGARGRYFDRREDPLVGQAPIQMDFHVPGPLELLEDHVVHAAAGVHDRRCYDRQAATVLDVPGRAEEPLGALQRIGVQAAGEDLAAGRGNRVVGPGQPREAVEQDHHIALVFDQSLRLLDDHFGHLGVALGRLVEGGADDLGLDLALPVGDFFGPLVDQQDDQDDLGVVLEDPPGDRLQHHGLTRPGLRHDQPALALADRGDEVHDARAELARIMLQIDPFLRIERSQVVKQDLVARDLGILEIDLLDLEEREVALALLGRADLAGYDVSGSQIEATDLGWGDVDVVRSGEVVGVGSPKKAEAVRECLQHALPVNDPVLLGLGLENGEDQLLLAQVRRAFDLQLPGDLVQFGDIALFELGQIHDRFFSSRHLRHTLPFPPKVNRITDNQPDVLARYLNSLLDEPL